LTKILLREDLQMKKNCAGFLVTSFLQRMITDYFHCTYVRIPIPLPTYFELLTEAEEPK
jgi:hypothetical protein